MKKLLELSIVKTVALGGFKCLYHIFSYRPTNSFRLVDSFMTRRRYCMRCVLTVNNLFWSIYAYIKQHTISCFVDHMMISPRNENSLYNTEQVHCFVSYGKQIPWTILFISSMIHRPVAYILFKELCPSRYWSAMWGGKELTPELSHLSFFSSAPRLVQILPDRSYFNVLSFTNIITLRYRLWTV